MEKKKGSVVYVLKDGDGKQQTCHRDHLRRDTRERDGARQPNESCADLFDYKFDEPPRIEPVITEQEPLSNEPEAPPLPSDSEIVQQQPDEEQLSPTVNSFLESSENYGTSVQSPTAIPTASTNRIEGRPQRHLQPPGFLNDYVTQSKEERCSGRGRGHRRNAN